MDPLSILLAGSKEEEEEDQVQTSAFIPAKVEKNLYDDQDTEALDAKKTKAKTSGQGLFGEPEEIVIKKKPAKSEAAKVAVEDERPEEVAAGEITFSAPTVVPLAGRGESLFAGLARGDLAKDDDDDDLFNLGEKDMDALENAVQVQKGKRPVAKAASEAASPGAAGTAATAAASPSTAPVAAATEPKKSAKEIFGNDDDDEDLFALASKSKPAKKSAVDDDDDLFALAAPGKKTNEESAGGSLNVSDYIKKNKDASKTAASLFDD